MAASPLMNSIKAMYNAQSPRTFMEKEVVPIMHHPKERKRSRVQMKREN